MTPPTRRVLVVEDDTTMRELLEEVMSDEGYEVRVASNGGDGLEVMEQWAPDLVLLDLMMPFMDAYEMREHQRLAGSTAATRILLLTAARDVEAAAARIGADAWLAKPFTLADISTTVRHLLEDRPDAR